MTADTTSTPESRARLAYTAYGKAVHYLNKDGQPMPHFDALPQQTRQAWAAAAGIIWDLAHTGRAAL